MSIKDQLLAKINDHNAVVAIVGLGYVGLPLAVAFAEHGFPVIGIDVDARKVTSLNHGESYVQDIPSERLAAIVAGGNPGSDGPRPPAPSGRRPTTPHSQPATRRSFACPRRSTRPATRTCASSSRPVSRWRSTSVLECS